MRYIKNINIGSGNVSALQKIKQFWQLRQKREKVIVVIGFIFIIILGFDYGIWQPFNAYQSKVLQEYNHFQANIPYIARTFKTYEQLKNNNQLPHMQSGLSLQSQITNMLVSEQLVPFGVKTAMQGNKAATISFKQVPFDSLMRGVESLNKNAIFVVKAAIKPVNGKGIVAGELTLAQFKS